MRRLEGRHDKSNFPIFDRYAVLKFNIFVNQSYVIKIDFLFNFGAKRVFIIPLKMFKTLFIFSLASKKHHPLIYFWKNSPFWTSHVVFILNYVILKYCVMTAFFYAKFYFFEHWSRNLDKYCLQISTKYHNEYCALDILYIFLYYHFSVFFSSVLHISYHAFHGIAESFI